MRSTITLLQMEPIEITEKSAKTSKKKHRADLQETYIGRVFSPMIIRFPTEGQNFLFCLMTEIIWLFLKNKSFLFCWMFFWNSIWDDLSLRNAMFMIAIDSLIDHIRFLRLVKMDSTPMIFRIEEEAPQAQDCFSKCKYCLKNRSTEGPKSSCPAF